MQRSMSWFGGKGVTEIARFASREDFAAILKNWQRFCFETGNILPMTAIAELNKRCKKGPGEECKAKLDLSSCSLEDGHIIALFQALAVAPVVAKLDLSKNHVTDEGGRCMVSLLKGQIHLSADLDLDDIADIPFLSEIIPPDGLSEKIRNDIQLLAAKLKQINAKGFIRQLHNKICEGGSMDAGAISKIIKEISGKSPEKAVIVGILTEGKVNNSYEHAYDALENICLRSLGENGVIEVFPRWREDELDVLLNSVELDENENGDDDIEEDNLLETEQSFQQEEYSDGEPTLDHSRPTELDDSEVAAETTNVVDSAKQSTPVSSPAKVYQAVSVPSPTITASPPSVNDSRTEDRYQDSPNLRWERSSSQMETPLTYSSKQGSLSTTPAPSPALIKSASPSRISPQPNPIPNTSSQSGLSSNSNSRATYIANLLAKVNTPGLLNAGDVPLQPTVLPSTDEAVVQNASRDEEKLSAENVVQVQSEESEFLQPSPVNLLAPSSPQRPVVDNFVAHDQTYISRTPSKQSGSPRNGTPSRVRDSFDAGDSRVTLDKAVEKGCLDLFGCELGSINLPDFLPTQSLRSIRTVILRSNSIADFDGARFSFWTANLTHLDISNNSLSGCIPESVLPPTLIYLDLSQNNLSDISAAISCVNLKTLLVFNNLIKSVKGLPPLLETLDISDNLITSASSLRAIASFSTRIVSLGIAGNPIFDSLSGIRTKLCSMLPYLRQLDGEQLPGYRIRKFVAADDGMVESKDSSKFDSVKSPTRITRKQQQEADKRRMLLEPKSTSRASNERANSKPKLSVTEAKDLLTRLTRPREIPKMPIFLDVPCPAPVKPKVKINKPLKMSQTSVMPRVPSPQQIEAERIVDKWMMRCNAEIGSAITLLDEAFWMINTSSLTPAAAARFSDALRRFSFVQDRLKLSPEVEAAVEILTEVGDAERRSNYSATTADMRALGSILVDVESAVTFCSSYSLSSTDLQTSVAVIMKKLEGAHVINKIMKLFGLDFSMKDSVPVADIDAEAPANSSIENEGLKVSMTQVTKPSSPPQKLTEREIGKYMDNLKNRLTAKARLQMQKKEVQSSITSIIAPAPTEGTVGLDESSELAINPPVISDATEQKSSAASSLRERLAHRRQDLNQIQSLADAADAKSLKINDTQSAPSESGEILTNQEIQESGNDVLGAQPVTVDTKLSLKDRLKARLKK